MIQVRISIPESAIAGEDVEVKTLAAHPMESGFRLDQMGKVIPRDLIQSFEVKYSGELVFAMEFGPGIAANPFVSFFLRAQETGDVIFLWRDQKGTETRMTRRLEVAQL